MLISKLNLKNFRSYENLDISFEPGLNVILGKNATGKTNIVEAIYLLSIGHSFRTDNDDELIKSNCEFASIEGNFQLGDETKKIKLTLTKDTKNVTCNSYKIERLSELTKILNVIVFKPEDVLFFNDSPSVRRKFLDSSISKMDYSYLKDLTLYNKLLKERNEMLKNATVDEVLMDVVTSQMINISKQIVLKRQVFINRLNEVIQKVVKTLKGENQNVKLRYFPYVDETDNFVEMAQKAFKEALEGDLKRKSTSVGVHRENFIADLNGRDISSFGSQGEKRIIALALMLCPYFLIEDKDKKPIVILDDVLSELDKTNQNRLINLVSKIGQVFITATHYEDQNVNTYYVSNHKVTRR